MDFSIVRIIIDIAVILFAVTIHEVSHGFLAYKLGDPTPEVQGRLTLNPVSHLDLVGSIIVPFVLIVSRLPVFGWAKPIMINPQNFSGDYKQVKRKSAAIAFAGPASNFLVAILAAGILRLLFSVDPGIRSVLYTSSSKPSSVLAGVGFILFELFIINVFLGLFNLIPIPPLDGGNILLGILPDEYARMLEQIQPYGFIILLVLIFTGLHRFFIIPFFRLFLSILG